MRRLIALAVLLGGGWSQLAALGCPMDVTVPSTDASAPSSLESEPDHHAAHAHEATGAATEAESPADTKHSDRDCRLMVGCAGPALTAPGPWMTKVAASVRQSTVLPPDRSRSTPVLATEPPPPRLPV